MALSDVYVRTLRHVEGLLAWLKEPSVEKVVFAKNCTLPIRSELLVETAARHGKELEFLQVASSPRISVQGKGYGEGDLIRQALEKSEVLRGAHDFIKITGKLFMPNARSVFTGEGHGEFFVAQNSAKPAIFLTRHLFKAAYCSAFTVGYLALLRRCRVPWSAIAAVPAGWIDTRCYRITIDCYRKHLLRSHDRVQDALGYTLENAVYDDLVTAPNMRSISSSPVIIGTSGTLGTISGSYSDEIRKEGDKLTRRLL